MACADPANVNWQKIEQGADLKAAACLPLAGGFVYFDEDDQVLQVRRAVPSPTGTPTPTPASFKLEPQPQRRPQPYLNPIPIDLKSDPPTPTAPCIAR